MSKSTQNFKETKLVDYCDREGNVSLSKKGNDPNGKWKISYPNGELLSSNFDFFLDEELEKGSIKFFVLDDSDEKWAREMMKLSEKEGELKSVLKSLTDFVNHRENKRIYIREVRVTSENPSEKRRVFTEEVLEIIPIILKQQNSRTEEWEDLFQKYQLEWMREHVPNSINMDTFNSVLEEFNINKKLITIVPDPVYEMSLQDMLQFERQIAMRFSPDGTCLLDSSHAIFYIFQSLVWGVNWQKNECQAEEKCKRELKEMVIQEMKQYLNNPEETLIPIDDTKATIKWLRKTHTAVRFPENHSSELQDVDIATAALQISTGLAQIDQFFGKEYVDLTNVVTRLMMTKVPVEARNKYLSILKTLQEYTSEQPHRKMLKKAQERAEKIRQRKEQAKPNKAKKPSSTNTVEPHSWEHEPLLDEQEYPESKLKITKNEAHRPYQICQRPFSLVDNDTVQKLDNTEVDQVLETEALESSSIEVFQKIEEDVVAVPKKEVEESMEKIGGLDKLDKELAELAEEKRSNRTEKMLRKVIREHEKLIKTLDDIKEIIEKREEENSKLKGLLDEKTKNEAKLGNKLKSVEVQVERLKNFERAADKMKKEKTEITSRLKDLKEENKGLKSSLDEVENERKLRDSELNQMRLELRRMKNQLRDKETVINRFKLEAENSTSRISEKETEISRLNNELSNSTETNESLVLQLSRMDEETRKRKMEEKEKNESIQSQISTMHNLLHQLSISADIEDPHQFRFTLQRLRNIKDRFQNKDQLKLAKTMTDKLIQMSNRSEIRELAVYEYQQYEANFQNYTQLVDLNIEKMKETRDCSLYSPLPKPPAFSDRFMNEYWLECDKKKKELEMDISDSECLICFFEMNSDQKTLKCDHCNKITHLKCASKWLQIHRSCPHCRREQLDPEEFPALS
ncbi:unnamed protein product [Caenorhabditis nigoni]